MSGNLIEAVAQSHRTCPHTPPCPSAESEGRLVAHVLCDHFEQGWELLCNGVVVFDDAGALMPDGRTLTPAVLPLPVRSHAIA